MSKPVLMALTAVAMGLGAVAADLPAPYNQLAAAVVAGLSMLIQGKKPAA
jgi:hypothetical protein